MCIWVNSKIYNNNFIIIKVASYIVCMCMYVHVCTSSAHTLSVTQWRSSLLIPVRNCGAWSSCIWPIPLQSTKYNWQYAANKTTHCISIAIPNNLPQLSNLQMQLPRMHPGHWPAPHVCSQTPPALALRALLGLPVASRMSWAKTWFLRWPWSSHDTGGTEPRRDRGKLRCGLGRGPRPANQSRWCWTQCWWHILWWE